MKLTQGLKFDILDFYNKQNGELAKSVRDFEWIMSDDYFRVTSETSSIFIFFNAIFAIWTVAKMALVYLCGPKINFPNFGDFWRSHLITSLRKCGSLLSKVLGEVQVGDAN